MIFRLLTLGGGQALAYLVLVVNMRALNRGKYLATAGTEIVYALMNFFLLHRIVEARSWQEAVAYTTGCTTGTMAAMWLTKHWRND